MNRAATWTIAGLAALLSLAALLAALWQAWQGWSLLHPALADMLTGAVFVGPVALGLAWGAISVMGYYHRNHRDAVHRWLDIEHERARQSAHPMLSSLHQHHEVTHAPMPLPANIIDAEVLPVANTPTFASLLDSGKIGRGKPLLLGADLDDGALLEGSWLDLYSTIISGLPGSGKTTAQRYLACQTALAGAKFVVVDPHAGAADDSLAATLGPLKSVYLCEPASDDRAIIEAVKLIDDVGKRRVSGKDKSRQPIILWVDETTALLNRRSIGDQLAALIEEIARQYRKVGVYCSASGQIWTADRSGGSSALRDSFASVWCHRMKRNQARLLLPTDDAQQVERLEVGQAVLWRTSGQSNRIAVPNTTAADVRRVASMLATDDGEQATDDDLIELSSVARRQPDGSQMVANGDVVSTASVSAEAARVAELFRSGLIRPADLVLRVRGIKSNEGRRYQTALEEIMKLLHEGMR